MLSLCNYIIIIYSYYSCRIYFLISFKLFVYPCIIVHKFYKKKVLPEAVCCCFPKTTLFTKHSIRRCISQYDSQSFVVIAGLVNELCMSN